MDRLAALRDWFDSRLDRAAERIEPAGEWLTERNDRIDAWLGRDPAPHPAAVMVLLRLSVKLVRSVALFAVLALVFFVVVPIAIVVVLAALLLVLSPLIALYWVIWWVLGAIGLSRALRYLVLTVVTVAGFRLARRVAAARKFG